MSSSGSNPAVAEDLPEYTDDASEKPPSYLLSSSSLPSRELNKPVTHQQRIDMLKTQRKEMLKQRSLLKIRQANDGQDERRGTASQPQGHELPGVLKRISRILGQGNSKNDDA